MDTRPLTNCGRSALTRSTRSSERSGRSRSAAMTSRRSRTTTPIPPSRILDLCGSWICCSRFFPGGCPRIGTRDSRRFGSAWVWHGLRFAGHGVTGPRCGASRRWDYASERSAVKSHIRIERGQSSRSFEVQLERRTVAFSVAVIKSLRTIPAGLESKIRHSTAPTRFLLY